MSSAAPRTPAREQRRGGGLLTELVRLVVVVLTTAVAVEFVDAASPLFDLWGRSRDLTPETGLLAAAVLGAGVGYVLGGVVGRFSVHRLDAVESSLADYSAGELLAAVIGGGAGLLVGAGVTWPVLLFDGRLYTVPLAMLVVVLLAGTGMRIGIRRGGDLLRTLGVSGRLDALSPTRGGRAKLVDTSALVDGRILDLCRSGFLEGVLVIPQFVLYELQGLADAGDEERRRRGGRGLDVLAGLQRAAAVTLEVTDRDYPDIAAVDAKLVQMAKDRGARLITVDAHLERVAEVQGVKVLNLHNLADTLRPPVVPGDQLRVRLVKAGKERGQGVGYLADGTMVVVESGRELLGSVVPVEVTGILSNTHGRMVFATFVNPSTVSEPASSVTARHAGSGDSLSA